MILLSSMGLMFGSLCGLYGIIWMIVELIFGGGWNDFGGMLSIFFIM